MREPTRMTECFIGTYDDPQGMLYDARDFTRGSAQKAFAEDIGSHFVHVRAVVRYARWLSGQEVWDSGGSEQWVDQWIDEHGLRVERGECRNEAGESVEVPEPPDAPPADFDLSDEYLPAWQFCDRDHPDAVKVFLCEERQAVKA